MVITPPIFNYYSIRSQSDESTNFSTWVTQNVPLVSSTQVYCVTNSRLAYVDMTYGKYISIIPDLQNTETTLRTFLGIHFLLVKHSRTELTRTQIVVIVVDSKDCNTDIQLSTCKYTDSISKCKNIILYIFLNCILACHFIYSSSDITSYLFSPRERIGGYFLYSWSIIFIVISLSNGRDVRSSLKQPRGIQPIDSLVVFDLVLPQVYIRYSLLGAKLCIISLS